MPTDCARQVNTATSWYIWRGEIFRFPISTLQRRKRQGGWDLKNVSAKSRALLYLRLQSQGQNTGTPTAEWLRAWKLHAPSSNPPYMPTIPAHMEYLRHCAQNSAYIAPQQPTETLKAYKRRIYNTLQTLLRATPEPAEMRVTRLWPNTEWTTVWRNLQDTPVTQETKVTWYRVVHEIIPTHERLHRIHMTLTDTCRQCDKTDTLRHRLTECGEGPLMWNWTKQRLATKQTPWP